jgi:hypothetical protein
MPVGFLFDVSGITGEVADEEDRLQAIEGNDDALVLGRGDRWPQRELSPRRVEVLAESFVGSAIREPDDELLPCVSLWCHFRPRGRCGRRGRNGPSHRVHRGRQHLQGGVRRVGDRELHNWGWGFRQIDWPREATGDPVHRPRVVNRPAPQHVDEDDDLRRRSTDFERLNRTGRQLFLDFEEGASR